jgi:RNA polymerase sigma-70 factor (ECF subfamily)
MEGDDPMAGWAMTRASAAWTLAADAEVAEERRQVELAVRGDPIAFRAIVERHHRGLFGLALRMVGDRTEAEDLVQEAFAKAYCNLADFDPGYRLSTWLYRITLNVCRDFLKSPRRRERPAHSAEMPESAGLVDATVSAPEQRDEVRRVQRALAQLRPKYREILVLKDLEELSYEEIRAITGAPITALKIRAVRARQRLRELLEASP